MQHMAFPNALHRTSIYSPKLFLLKVFPELSLTPSVIFHFFRREMRDESRPLRTRMCTITANKENHHHIVCGGAAKRTVG